uniref:BCL2 associated athanogene 1 n=1 Tax=Cynoglossus semilaevis TaxID=244447 RepID=A0A3P8W6C2_CYNSE
MSQQTITVTVAHGSAKHSLTLAGHDDGTGPTVKDLSDVLCQTTGVPAASQKLIFKGKSLKDLEESLSSYGIKDGCKLMMIGKRNSPEEEAALKKLKEIEKSVEQTAKKLEKIDREFIGLKNGFLAKDLQAEALGKLDHRVKIASEHFMKILEQIDDLVIYYHCYYIICCRCSLFGVTKISNTFLGFFLQSVPENFSDCRMKKKALVKTVQVHLWFCLNQNILVCCY